MFTALFLIRPARYGMVSPVIRTPEISHQQQNSFVSNKSKGENFVDSAEEWEEF
ncbi:hypothetical protein [uncultured Pseudoalteromonas sp.]|uniref:hypothetical protein n=1 Tax=uncultured Pseudoalteromonas sp. TaxID=114053 RepID=UPI00259453D2|nr:hypothetical protein [uncultured Pseudoalteromonas sp.]